jgi:predicted phosphodiesterase
MDVLRDDGVNLVAVHSNENGRTVYFINPVMTAADSAIAGRDEGTLVFGVGSDTHFGSSFFLQQSFYEVMRQLWISGVRTVFLAGDITEGPNDNGCRESLLRPDMEGQTDIAAEALLMHSGIQFYGIPGDHDLLFKKNPLDRLEKKANNFTNLGNGPVDMVCHGIRIRLIHGHELSEISDQFGYSAHAKAKRVADDFDIRKFEEAPHLLLRGHSHTFYRGIDHDVYVLQPGSFRDSPPGILDGDNEYYARRVLDGSVGAFRVELHYSHSAITSLNTTYMYPGMASGEKDYPLAETPIGVADSPIVSRQRTR